MDLRYSDGRNREKAKAPVTPRKNPFKLIAEKFKNIDVKKTVKNVAAATLISAVLLPGITKCGIEPIEKPPIEQVDAGKDAGSPDVGEEDVGVTPDTGKDAGSDVEQPDAEVKDGGIDAGPDVDEKDGGTTVDGGDVDTTDGSVDSGDGGSPDVCDGQKQTIPFTREQTDALPALHGGVEGQVTYTYEGTQEVICDQVQSEDVTQLTVSFNPPLQDDGNRMIAKEAREIKMFNVTAEVQGVKSENGTIKLILVNKESSECTFSGPFYMGKPATMCGGRAFSIAELIDDQTVRMFLADGAVGGDDAVKKEGEPVCRSPPNNDTAYRCGKIHTVDTQGNGQVKLVVVGPRAISIENGVQVQTRAFFPSQEKPTSNDPKPVYINYATWTPANVDVTADTQNPTPMYMINGFKIKVDPDQK